MKQPTPPARLLAKSTRPGMQDTPDAPQTLRGHTMMVLDAARGLMAARGVDALAAVGLPTDAQHLALLGSVLECAAAIHDLGKCSSAFQEMVRGADIKQAIRHEAATAWLCWPGQPLGDWLAAGHGEDGLRLAVAAAAGHHRKFLDGALNLEAPSPVLLWVNHPDFHALLRAVGKQLGLPGEPPQFAAPISVEVTERRSPRPMFTAWTDELDDHLRSIPTHRAILAVAKGLLVGADVAGSALPRDAPGTSPRNWVQDILGQRASKESWDDLVSTRLSGKSPRPFQRLVASSRAPITLARAGCGTGKTVAAYMWHAQQAPERQLWVTYPTTGTATEGFRDYVLPSDVDGMLDHMRAQVDWEVLGLAEGDDEQPRDADRVEALRSWGKSVITCTADTVLGLVQNQRKGVYALPGLVRSSVVFDEIHAYDTKLFACLLEFLRRMPGIPVLLMTASLPAHRRRMLDELCRQIHGVSVNEVTGPADLEALPRYVRDTDSDVQQRVAAMLDAGKKVLWVCNTVGGLLDLAQRAWPVTPHIYHSRFRYEDRVRAHGAVVAAFSEPGPVLALTTQVAEMSLDLSADLLVTDLAPVPALIQRLGRLNRRTTVENPTAPAPFVVLPVTNHLPYATADLRGAEAWLARLGAGVLSQADLANGWEQDPAISEETWQHPWFAGGLWTRPDACRESTPGITVLLGQDRAAVLAKPSEAPRYAVPMTMPPKSMDWRKWERTPRTGFLPVAPDDCITYDRERGAAWQKQ